MKFSYPLIKKLLSEAPPKAKLADGLNSHSLETENLDGDLFDISLPSNRYSDAASHLGIAREVAAIFGSNPHTKFGVGVKLKNPVKTIVDPPTDRGFLEVKVEDGNFCPRYAARYFENVKIGNSPAWMREILHTCGLKPINNVVDLMNFVMLEVGQALHAFDFDKVKCIIFKNQISKI
ncbi:MAG: hypothetical protein HY433_03080 [Candidatus Liptonbacteria bacterium]|nr:hypothetical protein [Candidatus Liptonbacteria bacterium]